MATATTPLTPEQEYEQLSSQLHELNERTAKIERETSLIRLRPKNTLAEAERGEHLKAEYLVAARKIQELLPRWSQLKILLTR